MIWKNRDCVGWLLVKKQHSWTISLLFTCSLLRLLMLELSNVCFSACKLESITRKFSEVCVLSSLMSLPCWKVSWVWARGRVQLKCQVRGCVWDRVWFSTYSILSSSLNTNSYCELNSNSNLNLHLNRHLMECKRCSYGDPLKFPW